MRKSWWKVPLFYLAAGWLRFRTAIRLGRFAIVTLPDGPVSSDSSRWMLLSGVLFALVLAAGLLFFRRTARRELFFSASRMAALNVVAGLRLTCSFFSGRKPQPKKKRFTIRKDDCL